MLPPERAMAYLQVYLSYAPDGSTCGQNIATFVGFSNFIQKRIYFRLFRIHIQMDKVLSKELKFFFSCIISGAPEITNLILGHMPQLWPGGPSLLTFQKSVVPHLGPFAAISDSTDCKWLH